jgi:alpha-L-arabinofuranosidase
MSRNKRNFLKVLTICLFLTTFASGAFAQDDGELSWQTHIWSRQQNATFEWADIGKTGDKSLEISADGDGVDASWYVEIPVEAYATYKLSGWIKTENVVTANGGRGALLNLHNVQSVRTDALTGTNDWTEVSIVFDTNENDVVWINCLFGGWGLAAGTAWYDDVRLELLSQTEWNPSVTIDAEDQAEPMPVYVYGQFIEHMGRCIYGGIWAEMLEDRKFYDPVGSEDSPWDAIGGVENITMVEEDAFVGEHTPVVSLDADAPRGISQSELGLVKGKSYDAYIWLKKEGDVDSVATRFIWGKGKSHSENVTIEGWELSDEYMLYKTSFTASVSTDEARVEVLAKGTGRLFIGTASLMPADNIEGMRADTLALLEELDSPVYRWPGGNFVSGYDWRDGIGDRDRRPPRKNPAWTGIEHNDFGMDEFMRFCELLGTEPYIAVNSGLGGVENAIAELEYANGSPDSPMGSLRAENGNEDPYAVKWWGIGNEMYGGWQLGNMPLEDYIVKHNEFADAFRDSDPTVQLVAVGEAGPWSEGMMQGSADHMELISEHFYRQTNPSVAGHVQSIPDAIRHKAEAHRRYRAEFDALDGKDIRIAMDEWNYWYGPHLYGELGTQYFLKDALGIAAGINEYARCTDIVFMANYAQTVNVIGCIKTDKTDACFDTTGLVLMLYRREFGTIPVATDSQRPLDVQAALTEDGRKLTISIVNPLREAYDIPMTLSGVTLTGTGVKHEIAGDDPLACNVPGEEPGVVIETSEVEGIGGTLSVAPQSATLFVLDLE